MQFILIVALWWVIVALFTLFYGYPLPAIIILCAVYTLARIGQT